MNFEQKKFDDWLEQQEFFLPGVNKLLKDSPVPALILGASVLMIYSDQISQPVPALKPRPREWCQTRLGFFT